MTLVIHSYSEKRSISVAGMVLQRLKECGFKDDVRLEPVQRPEVRSSDFSYLINAVQEDGNSAAVCSMAELPLDIPSGMSVLHTPRRLTRTDCLLSRGSYTRLQSGATVCCSGKLRRAQLLRARGDLDVMDTGMETERLIDNVEVGRFTAAAFAACEAEALGYGGKDSLKLYELPVTHFVPEAGQGVNVLIFPDKLIPEGVAQRIDNQESKSEAAMERRVLRILASQIDSPLGISCISFGSGFTLRVQLLSADGGYERRISKSIGKGEKVEFLISDFLEAVPSEMLRK